MFNVLSHTWHRSPILSPRYPVFSIQFVYYKCITLLGNEVDVGVQFTGAEQVGNLCTAVEGRVQYTQSSPTTNARVQHGCLHVGSFSLRQTVVMLYLHRQCSVTGNGSQLDVGRIRHVEIAVEVNRTNTCMTQTAVCLQH